MEDKPTLDEIRKKAQEDMNKIFNRDKEFDENNLFKERANDFLIPHKQAYLSHQLNVYWMMVVQHFRKEVEELKQNHIPLSELQKIKEEEFTKGYDKGHSDMWNAARKTTCICKDQINRCGYCQKLQKIKDDIKLEISRVVADGTDETLQLFRDCELVIDQAFSKVLK